MPFGGYKQSGYGRDLQHALDNYTERKPCGTPQAMKKRYLLDTNVRPDPKALTAFRTTPSWCRSSSRRSTAEAADRLGRERALDQPLPRRRRAVTPDGVELTRAGACAWCSA
jgi:hypothetical protein